MFHMLLFLHFSFYFQNILLHVNMYLKQIKQEKRIKFQFIIKIYWKTMRI